MALAQEITGGGSPGRHARLYLRGTTGRWLAIFGVSLGLLLIRLLVPTLVGQADNRDGPRLMCGLGLGPVTGHHPRFFRFSYFQYVPKHECAGRVPYPSSELFPLVLGRLLTPVLGLSGTLNLIAVAVVLCALVSVAIASLAVGLRIRLWAQLLVAAACWLIIWDYVSSYGQRLHHIQAVDMLFTDIVTKRATAPAQLRALGLPVSWARYAGHYYWDTTSVRQSPLYTRYAGKLSDGNITHYLLTHPGSIFSVGQSAAIAAQRFRITSLGDYPADAGHPKGAYESRVVVLTWLMHQLPPGLGLWGLVPLWLVMAAMAIAALAWGRARAWHRNGAVMVLCMIGCAVVAFIPPAYYAGISTTRHMVGMNLATSLAFVLAAGLAASMIQQALTRTRSGPAPAGAASGKVAAVSPGPRR